MSVDVVHQRLVASRWPRWSGPPAYEELGRYVIGPETLARLLGEGQGAGDGPRSSGQPAERTEQRLGQLRALVEDFIDRRYPYKLESWDPAGQWIRDPRWFERQSGTCLDFAVVFAARCLQHRLAPILAIQVSHTVVAEAHAFLLIDLERDLDTRIDRTRFTDVAMRADGASCLHVADPEFLQPLVESGVIAAVDLTAAAADMHATFESVRRAADHALFDPRTSELVLVDVAALRAAGQEPYEPLAENDWPAVTRRGFTGRRSGEVYVERPGLDELFAAAGDRIVLYGARGTGKSLLAQHLALKHGNGSGWFVDGSDREALVRSLAACEAAERSLPTSASASSDDVTGFAALALHRLQHPTPWIVVVDNCDSGPETIADWLPRPRAGHRVIVTTSEPDAWIDWVRDRDPSERWSSIEVPALGSHEVLRIGCPEPLLDLVDGRPLFAQAFARLAMHDPALGTSPLVAAPDGVDPAAWLLVHSAVRVLDAPCRAAAESAAWLQPDTITTTALQAQPALDQDQQALVEALVSSGLVSHAGNALAMHRLVGKALRTAMDDLAVVRVIGSPSWLEHSVEHADSFLLEECESRLRSIASDRSDLARALWSLMTVLEPRNQVRHASDIASHLETTVLKIGSASGAAEDLIRWRADALHSQARWANQNQDATPAEHDHAMTQTDQARELRQRLGDDLGVAKSDALEAILRQKPYERRAAAVGLTPADLPGLEDVVAILERSHAARKAELGDLHVDTARARFNLGAPHLLLAQADPHTAPAHLDEAESAYRDALRARLELYRTEMHPHVPASWYGLGLVSYYRAMGSTSTSDRTELLRQAFTDTLKSLRLRESLDAAIDGPHTAKSALLLAKIADARTATSREPTKAADVLRLDWERRARELMDAGLFEDHGS